MPINTLFPYYNGCIFIETGKVFTTSDHNCISISGSIEDDDRKWTSSPMTSSLLRHDHREYPQVAITMNQGSQCKETSNQKDTMTSRCFRTSIVLKNLESYNL